MKIAFKPYGESNKYIENSIEAIRRLGHEVVPFSEAKARDTQIVILNWYESTRERRGAIKNLALFIVKGLAIFYLRALNKRIVFVMHNKQSHGHSITSRWLQRLLIRHCDAIQILSRPSLKYLPEKYAKKAFYVPHPNYVCAYPPLQKYTREELGIPSDRLVYLFVGLIRPYKNVEMLVEIAKKTGDRAHFVIAGAPSSEAYRDELLRQMEGASNITQLFTFIPDEDLCSLINLSDALVLPYDVSSSLNSGVAILAFSNKRTVIAPLIATLEDIAEENCFIGYTYKSAEEHKRILEEKLKRPFCDARLTVAQTRERLHEMGQRAYDYVNEHNDLSAISEKYREMFDALNSKL